MDSMSIHSDSPLHRLGSPPAQYPPPLPSQAQFNTFPQSHDEQMRHVPSPAEPMDRPFLPYDNERAQTMPLPSGHERRPGLGHGGHHSSNSRNGSWDLLAGIRKFEHSYEEFDSRNASASHLAFADGDMPNNKVSSLKTDSFFLFDTVVPPFAFRVPFGFLLESRVTSVGILLASLFFFL